MHFWCRYLWWWHPKSSDHYRTFPNSFGATQCPTSVSRHGQSRYVLIDDPKMQTNLGNMIVVFLIQKRAWESAFQIMVMEFHPASSSRLTPLTSLSNISIKPGHYIHFECRVSTRMTWSGSSLILWCQETQRWREK